MQFLLWPIVTPILLLRSLIIIFLLHIVQVTQAATLSIRVPVCSLNDVEKESELYKVSFDNLKKTQTLYISVVPIFSEWEFENNRGQFSYLRTKKGKENDKRNEKPKKTKKKNNNNKKRKIKQQQQQQQKKTQKKQQKTTKTKQNIWCGSSLESRRRGDSYEYPQHYVLWRHAENYP